MKSVLTIFLAGMTVLLGSCYYNDNGVYFVDPVPGEPPVISVTTNLDTLAGPEVTDSLEVTYDVVIENGEFYLVEANVSNNWIFYSDTTHGSFWLYPGDVTYPGVDTLYLYFYYSTNSNSLADIVKLEANLIRRTYGIDFKEGGLP
jgi:hypothetical protein